MIEIISKISKYKKFNIIYHGKWEKHALRFDDTVEYRTKLN